MRLLKILVIAIALTSVVGFSQTSIYAVFSSTALKACNDARETYFSSTCTQTDAADRKACKDTYNTGTYKPCAEAAGVGFAGDPISSEGYTPFGDLGKLVGNVFTVVIILASILLFLYLILGGIQWLTSGGDKMATQAARDRITAALTGLLIILAIWGVFRILELAFGISVLGGIKVPVGPENTTF